MKFSVDITFVALTLLLSAMCQAQSTSLYGEASPAYPASAAPMPTATRAPVAALGAAGPSSGSSSGGSSGPAVGRAAPAPIPMAAPPRMDSRPRVAPALMQTSFLAVQVPEPRRFAQNDLVTIVISERIEDSADSSLDTEKKSDWKGEIKDFPSIDLRQLLQAQLKGTPLANPPKVDVGLEKSFEGDGKHRNRNTLTARMTARIIDVKPNGLLAVEARKHLRIDREELTIVLTGVLRPEDVNADNTVLSSQLADVRIAKELKGELRDVKDRGLIGKFFAILLDF